MRILLASCTFMLALAAARAEEKHNTLTPEQAADGWRLLFDGGSTEGLRTQGNVTVKDGILIVGGNVASRVGPKDSTPGEFEWQLEYRVTGPGSVSVLREQSAAFSNMTSSQPLSQPPGDSEAWQVLRLTVRINRQNGTRDLTIHRDGASKQSPIVTNHLPGDMSLAVGLQVQPGTQLHLRNVILKADPPSQTELYWLYVMVGGLVAVVIALVLFAYWRSARRRARED